VVDGNVYRKAADDTATTRLLPDSREGKCFSADYHQQYLAKNPNGYCGIGGYGVPFKLAELQLREKA